MLLVWYQMVLNNINYKTNISFTLDNTDRYMLVDNIGNIIHVSKPYICMWELTVLYKYLSISGSCASTFHAVYHISDGYATLCSFLGQGKSGIYTAADCISLACLLGANALNYKPSTSGGAGQCFVRSCTNYNMELSKQYGGREIYITWWNY